MTKAIRKQSSRLVLVLFSAAASVLAQSASPSEKASRASEPARTVQVPHDVHTEGKTPSLLVKNITTDKSEVLSEQEIRTVVSEFENRELTQVDLKQLIEKLNRLYASKGVSTARAVLTAQTVRDGVLHIRLIESKLGKITVHNKTRTRDAYFLNRVSANRGEILRATDLQKQLAYFNVTNDVKMRAVLQPGTEFGSTDVVLQAEGPNDFEVTTFSDNAGRDTIGLYRGGATVTHKSVFGNRDPLTVTFLGADGTLFGGGSYSVPLGTHSTRLGAAFNYNTIALNGGVLGSAGLIGDSYDAVLKLSQKVFASPNSSLSASLAAHYKTSLLSAEGFPLSRTRVRSLELSSEWQRSDTRGAWLANNGINGGFDNFRGGFVRYNGELMRVQTLARNVTAIARASGQVNGVNPLAAIEQMQIGGVATVRGYPEAALIGDRGYTLTGEVNFPVIGNDWAKKRIKMAAFVDGGDIVEEGPNGSSKPHDTSLVSTGFGFLFRFTERVSGRVDFGVPLRNKAGIPDVGIHFSVQSTFGFPLKRTREVQK